MMTDNSNGTADSPGLSGNGGRRYPDAYVRYLVHFHAERDYFECHEVLEEYWKEHPGDADGEAYVGLIQLAVSLYHQRRGNLAGAVKMLSGAIRRLGSGAAAELGIAEAELQRLMGARLVELGDPAAFVYRDLDIPLADQALLQACEETSGATWERWGQPSDLSDRYLIHKHTLRDRSGVVEERERQRKQRQEKRGEGA
ncbi:DUF309 domain-containing protein [Paenibacillus caseinilyticus]|uniref:DUF309 domain-containing protein n=1 Tax=Paenibacillus mucilaginosus K02 TaxID=997761 RepID=I0BIG4_9BACL|nr:DUF309 domain-containing protein [Paenibacillus mucilaginosus]AFH62161.2 hypothetical protein B2K_15765 [Paenibacillus mucilaginosus K02]